MAFFLQPCFASDASSEKEKSAFYLVSVGGGDADLITVRAINTIKKIGRNRMEGKDERVIKGRLNTILEQVGDEKFPFEHLVYVGDFLTQRIKRDR